MGNYVVRVPVRGFEYWTVEAASKTEAMRKVGAGENCELLDLRILSWAKPCSANFEAL